MQYFTNLAGSSRLAQQDERDEPVTEAEPESLVFSRGMNGRSFSLKGKGRGATGQARVSA